jgi:hypothetical protein
MCAPPSTVELRAIRGRAHEAKELSVDFTPGAEERELCKVVSCRSRMMEVDLLVVSTVVCSALMNVTVFWKIAIFGSIFGIMTSLALPSPTELGHDLF